MKKTTYPILGAVIDLILQHASNPSISGFKLDGVKLTRCLMVNDHHVLPIRYSGGKNSVGQYQFNFTDEVIDNLTKADAVMPTRIALVCEEDGVVCDITVEELLAVKKARDTSLGDSKEELLPLMVELKKRSFEVYANGGNYKSKKPVGKIKKSLNFPSSFLA